MKELQKKQIVAMSIQTLLAVLEWNDESALITSVPYLCSIILCFPSVSFTFEHLNSILTLSQRTPPFLQYDVYLMIHFILNNWRSDFDIRTLLELILFASHLPSDLIQSVKDVQDPILIEQVLQSTESDYNRDYTFHFDLGVIYRNAMLFKWRKTTIQLLVTTLFVLMNLSDDI